MPTIAPAAPVRGLGPVGDEAATILPGPGSPASSPSAGRDIGGRPAAPPPGADDQDTRTPGTDLPREPDASGRSGGPPRTGPLSVGQDFGSRYHILQTLGVGGMGAVYKAWDAELSVAVALKVIRPDVLNDPGGAQEIERRFKRELLLARQVTHKSVVRIHDLGEIDGIKYITMSYVGGEDLATTLSREGRLPVARVLHIARQIVSGMQAAHEAGVVHRDLKPANIMLDGEDNALIMDFGIALSSDHGGKARAASAGRDRRVPARPGSPSDHGDQARAASTPLPRLAPARPDPASERDDDAPVTPTPRGRLAPARPDAGTERDDRARPAWSRSNADAVAPANLAGAEETMIGADGPPAGRTVYGTHGGTVLATRAGGIVGTLEYMSPEQSTGGAVDHHTDIYAFGLIVSDLLLGPRQVPAGSTPWKEMTARVSQAPPPLRSRDPGLPEAVDAIVSKCIQIDQADRYQTTAELAHALDRLDAGGNLIPEPVVKRFTPRVLAAAAVLVSALVGGTYWMARGPAQPPAPHAPVSVLVADFKNDANDPVFDGLIEQALTVGVEGASFVTAYPRRDALRLAGQIKPGGRLDDATAMLVALREGVGRVVTGSISKASPRYTLTVKVVDPTGNKTLMSWDTEADNREAVLGAVGRMAAKVRTTLGDTTASDEQLSNEETFTAASLEAAHAYAAGQELQWAGKYEAALAEYQRAVQIDPNLGRAYAGLGAVANSLGRRQDAEEYDKQAMARINRMTDREKYRTRGGYYLLTRNADKAREEMQALVQQFPSDSAGLSNLALAEFYRRDMAKAVELGRKASAIFPRAVLYKNNAALFAMYAGDFAGAEKEASGVLAINKDFAKAYLSIALSQLAADQPDKAAQTYLTLSHLPGSAKWLAACGEADLAMYQGRLADAAKILDGAIKDETNVSRRARLTVTQAEVRALQGRGRDASTLALKAATMASDEGVAFLAGRVLIDAGQAAPAQEIAARLSQRLDRESQVSAGVLEGELALKRNEPRAAIEKFQAAQKIADSWLGRFGLGRAYLMAGAVAEADSEFDVCLKRRGEATAVLLDDVPTYRLMAPILYYEGRVHQGLGSPAAADHYKAFLAIKQNGDEQGLVTDARRRLESLK